MTRSLLLAILVLAACSQRPVGQSEFFDPWENPQLQAQPVEPLSAEVVALNQQIEAKRLENAAEIAAQNGDAALVASLEAAIATAENDQRAQALPVQATAPLGAPLAPLDATGLTTSAAGPAQPVVIQGSGQISDNSFSTVVQNQSIETDAARLAALSQSNVVLEATPLPERNDGVNPAAFARSTSHNIGERLYKRSSRSSASQRCRRYGNPDAAQRAFLAAGGPESDELMLDPDGDGFVCGWSPIPFRNLRVGG